MPAYTRIKFCGMTRPEDAVKAAELGVDAIGLVFYPKSPRVVDIAQAQQILLALPPFVTTVAVVANASFAEITKIITELPIDVLQFHGDETVADCEHYNKPYIKALRVQPSMNVANIGNTYHAAKAILLDTFHPQHLGGSGEVFDWQRIPNNLSKPFILAGGLTPQNVTTAIQTVRPYAVDVSSGVESAPGIKDFAKMAAFIQGVKHANAL